MRTGSFPSPSVVWPSIEAFLVHCGARPACFLVWTLDSDEAKRDELRCWLRGDGIVPGELLGRKFNREARLSTEREARPSTEVKSFLADLLDKAEKTPQFKQKPSITITFDDVMNRFYSKENRWSSLHLREKEPASKTPEAPRSPPIHGGGFSALVGALVFARLLHSNRNAVSPEEI
ncbi:hypothetical protein PG990_006810 [Apiospora arundinis]